MNKSLKYNIKLSKFLIEEVRKINVSKKKLEKQIIKLKKNSCLIDPEFKLMNNRRNIDIFSTIPSVNLFKSPQIIKSNKHKF